MPYFRRRRVGSIPAILIVALVLTVTLLTIRLAPTRLTFGPATPAIRDTTETTADITATATQSVGNTAALPTKSMIPAGGRARWADITMRGTNYSPTGSDWCNEDPSPWNCVWKNWNWQKINYEIDLASSLDLNGFRIIGGAGAVYKGEITEEKYMTQVAQIASYLEAKGMYFYPTCTAAGQEHMGGIPIDWLAAFCGRVAHEVEQYDNVPGMDIAQEYDVCWDYHPTGSYDECLQWARQLAGAIRRAAPTLPITFSDAILFFDKGKMADYGPLVDYFDIHVYSEHSPDDFANYFADPNHKQLVFGEIGDKGEQPENFFKSVLQVASTYHVSVFQWAIVERKGGFGLYDDAGTLDRNKYDPYSQFPTSGQFAGTTG